MNTAPKPATRHFDDINARSSVDYALRTARQNQMQLNLMADIKANIMITVSSLVFSIVIGQINKPDLLIPLATLGLFSLGALFTAIISVLPKFVYPKNEKGEPDWDSPNFNIMFFGHFSTMDRDEFRARVSHLMATDALVYESIVEDLYSQGVFLGRRKFKFVRYSYICFLTGCALTAIQIPLIFLN